jgi:transcriptional regulator GlxA family with amidase domain
MTSIQSILSSIDTVIANNLPLHLFGYDDCLYRVFASILNPSIVKENQSNLKQYENEDLKLKNLCDYIDNNITNPISLTNLEEQTGLKARSLNYLFLKKYSKPPMVFVRERRLDAVRKYILKSKSKMEAHNLAKLFCFPSGHLLAKYYYANFGETIYETNFKSRFF